MKRKTRKWVLWDMDETLLMQGKLFEDDETLPPGAIVVRGKHYVVLRPSARLALEELSLEVEIVQALLTSEQEWMAKEIMAACGFVDLLNGGIYGGNSGRPDQFPPDQWVLVDDLNPDEKDDQPQLMKKLRQIGVRWSSIEEFRRLIAAHYVRCEKWHGEFVDDVMCADPSPLTDLLSKIRTLLGVS